MAAFLTCDNKIIWHVQAHVEILMYQNVNKRIKVDYIQAEVCIQKNNLYSESVVESSNFIR